MLWGSVSSLGVFRGLPGDSARGLWGFCDSGGLTDLCKGVIMRPLR